jgi:1-acyl-sn-glycerol-3-phosphate acyltransferase
MEWADIQPEVDLRLIHEFLPVVKILNAYHRYSVEGTDFVPRKGRVLILVNHSLATYDILLLGAAIYAYTTRLPRGLADSHFFRNTKIGEFGNKVGMVEAGPENAQALLEEEHAVILAPGGMREALRPSNEKYQIKWDKRFGFARLAIRTQSPVILAACPKADELYDVSESILTKLLYKRFKLPFVLARGLGLSPFPRPVKLTHYLHAPILPPTFKGNEPPERLVSEFQEKLISEMEAWMELHQDG